MLLPQETIFDKKNTYVQEKALTYFRKDELFDEPLVFVDKFSKSKFTYASLISPEVFSLKAVFPFDLFPNELIIEEKRIIIKEKQLPYFISTTTISLKDILIFQVNQSMFFASVYIKSFNTEHTISWLKSSDARVAKEILDGLKLKQNESLKMAEETNERKLQALQIMGNIY